ncbi:MAG TPA: AsmA-like C-terminal region-containing protein [Candidatus Eisenbacteria bacterium]|nr:AsmA-like C-terminal region-containing protein [Candidatus Eisenbacteria bacterium]
MIGRLLRLLVGIVVVVTLAAGLLVWRLQRAPISLDVFVPRIEAALGGAAAVRIGSVELVWNPERHRPELRARDVKLGSPDEGSTVSLAEVAIRFALRDLLHGGFAVTGIEVLEPQLNLVRSHDGRIVAGTAAPDATAPEQGPALERMDAVLGRLRYVAISDGDLNVVDEVTGTRWHVPDVDGMMWREGTGIRLELEMKLECDAARVPLSVQGLFDEGAKRFEVQASAGALETAAGLACWPPGAASEARAWVKANVTGGTVRDARLVLAGHAGEGAGLDSLAATLAFGDLTVRYVDTMPPARGVEGTGAFSLGGAEFKVGKAAVDALQVKPASVRLAWAGEGPPRIAIEAQFDGPLSGALAVLDAEPIAMSAALRISTRGATGRMAGRVGFDFRLGGKPTPAGLGLAVSATLRGAAVPEMPEALAMTAGDLDIKVDGQGLGATGQARLRGVPVRLRITERWGDPTARRIEISARLDRAARATFDLDFGSTVEGPVDTRIQLGRTKDGQDVADVDVDLQTATVTMPGIALRKAAGVPGRLTSSLVLADGRIARVERFQLAVGQTRVRGSATRASSGDRWATIDADATLAPQFPGGLPGTAVLALRGSDGPRYGATLRSRDAGNLVASFGNPNVRGGTLSFEGTIDPFAAGSPFAGRLTCEKITVADMPWLIRVITLTSIAGLLGSDNVVPFDAVTATLDYRAPTLVVKDLRAQGPKLDLLLDGAIDLVEDRLDFTGTLIPSYYRLNGVLGRIPFIGGVLSKATGDAISAVTFTVRGTRQNPDVSVKPLSTLAPGALRDVFQKLGL